MQQIVQEILVEAGASLAESAFKALAKTSSNLCKRLWAEFQREEEAPPVLLDEAGLAALFEGIFPSGNEAQPEVDFAGWAADCGEAFLQSLQSCRDDDVCAWCSPTLFDHPVRKQVLLETLACVRPAGWDRQQTLNLVKTGTRRKSYGVDFDVYFNVDGEWQTMALLLVFAQDGEYLVVKDLYWSSPSEPSWR
ncbi:MAG TPA: hypothetical protein VFJ16_04145 [Longimicrobium sp.]|nr:hypothetical protein [Longimicrobium sp.]